MKRFSFELAILMIGLLISGHPLWSQKKLPSDPVQHTKQVYVDPGTNTIYWPLSMPFYLRLATGPDKNSESFLLQNVFSHSKGEVIKSVKNGVQLEMSGKQFIRWHNYLTGDSVLFVFYSDGNAPTVTLNFEGAKSHQIGNQLIYGKGLKVSLSAKDSLSGVQDIFVSIDEEDFETYKTPFSFTQEKPYSLRTYAVDHVGNASPVVSKNFTIDLTPPKTKHRILAHAIENILAQQAKIELKASDKPAGVKHIFFKFDSSQAFSIYSGKPIGVDKLPSGDHKLIYYSVDRVGNQEDTTIFRFYIDNKPPQINTFVVGDQFIKKTHVYISPRSKIKFQADDNKIGVEAIEYSVNKKSYQTYTEPFTLASGQKVYSIAYRAKDKLGNLSPVGHLLFQMDATPPQSKYRFDGYSFEQRGHFWVSSSTKIAIQASDPESGVQSIKFKIGDDPEKLYDAPFALEKEGTYSIQYFSVDQVNNAEDPQAVTVVVDNTPPKIMMSFSSAPIAGSVSDTSTSAYPLNTSLFLGSTDASSGGAGIWYSVNGSQEKQYRSPLVFKKPGAYEIAVRAVDHVHNQAVKKVHFAIKD